MKCIRCGKDSEISLCKTCVAEGLERRGIWNFCPWCNRIYLRAYGERAKVFCSEVCAREYSEQMKQAKKRWDRNEKADVDKIYDAQKRFFQDIDAIKALYERKHEKSLLKKSETNIYNRKCHDCGRPTTNYRCDRCQKKWRQKNRVGDEAREEDLFTSSAVSMPYVGGGY